MKRWLPLGAPFLSWGRSINQRTLRADVMAGITGAVIALPQAVAYAFIAGLPPEYGLYSAIIISVIAALFGSSWHMVSGPAAAISIVIMSVVSGLGELDPAQYLSAVLTLTLLVGLMQLGMGILRLGSLVNFISHSVVIAFTAGAAILIGASQLKHVLGVAVPGGLSFIDGLLALLDQTDAVNYISLGVGAITLLSALLVRRLNRRWPHLLIGMTVGSVTCLLLNGADQGVALVGALPGTLPPLSLPDLSANTIQPLASGAFALALLGLIEAVSIARAIALRSQQQISGNQEFIGQGLANTIGSFFSCFASSGSFTRSGANYDAGAKTPLAAVFSAGIQASVLLLAPGLTAYLPLPAMAGAVLLIAWNLIDLHHIRQIIKSSRNETLVLTVTFLATLFVELEFAIYIGVFLSLALYLRRTSRPSVMEVAPIPDHPRRQIKNTQRFSLQQCPQLKIIRIDGSLFFGAIDHIQQRIRALSNEGDTNRLLIIGKGINFIDVAGAEMLIQESRRLQQRGGKLMFSSLKGTVMDELRANGYLQRIGEELFYDSPEAALSDSVVQLNKEVCQRCSARIFRECATPANSEMIPVTRL